MLAMQEQVQDTFLGAFKGVHTSDLVRGKVMSQWRLKDLPSVSQETIVS